MATLISFGYSALTPNFFSFFDSEGLLFTP